MYANKRKIKNLWEAVASLFLAEKGKNGVSKKTIANRLVQF